MTLHNPPDSLLKLAQVAALLLLSPEGAPQQFAHHTLLLLQGRVAETHMSCKRTEQSCGY